MFFLNTAKNKLFFFYFEKNFFLYIKKNLIKFRIKYKYTLFFFFCKNIIIFHSILKSMIKMRYMPITIKQILNFYVKNKIHVAIIHFFGKKIVIRNYFFLTFMLKKNSSLLLNIRSTGVGYKFSANINMLFVKMGYSHFITIILPLNILLERINKYSINLKTNHRKFLYFFSDFLLKLRIPNIYTGKGLKMKGQKTFLKKGKISQF